MKIELERDGFAADDPIVLDTAIGKIAFSVENRTGNVHDAGVRLGFPLNTQYELRQDGHGVPLQQTGDWTYPWRAVIKMTGASSKIELVRTAR